MRRRPWLVVRGGHAARRAGLVSSRLASGLCRDGMAREGQHQQRRNECSGRQAVETERRREPAIEENNGEERAKNRRR